jgi:hypothetical protein
MNPYLIDLIKAYKKIVENNQDTWKFEEFQIIECIHNYRMTWKPENVKVILLAESHVFTKYCEYKNTFSSPINSNYTRFIYCLGYGEKDFFIKNLIIPKAGTPQFWTLFNKTRHSQFAVLKKDEKKFSNRISNKINLLQDMKNNGIWLLDASIVGIYENGKKPSNSIYNRILRDSYAYYCEPIILKEKPDLIIIIGKGVNNSIGKLVKKLNISIEVIDQPQARKQINTIDSVIEKYPNLF